MATSHVRRACRKALAAYLKDELGIDVSDSWPLPGVPLAESAITVLLGPRVDERKFQPRPVSQTAVEGSTTLADVVWRWGTVEFDLQLDAWSSYEVKRDELEVLVEAALNRPPATTLGASTTALDLAPGLALYVPENFGAVAAFRFKALPGLPETSQTVQSGDWRATWTGSCAAPLLREIRGPLIKTLKIQQKGTGISGTQTTTLTP